MESTKSTLINNFSLGSFKKCPNCKGIPMTYILLNNRGKVHTQCNCHQKEGKALNNIETIEEYLKNSEEVPKTNKTFCEDPNCPYKNEGKKEAKDYCNACRKYLCSKCLEEHSNYSNHDDLNSNPNCQEEGCDQQSSSYCFDCSMYICSKDSQMKHSNHKIKEVLPNQKEMKAEVEKIRKSFNRAKNEKKLDESTEKFLNSLFSDYYSSKCDFIAYDNLERNSYLCGYKKLILLVLTNIKEEEEKNKPENNLEEDENEDLTTVDSTVLIKYLKNKNSKIRKSKNVIIELTKEDEPILKTGLFNENQNLKEFYAANVDFSDIRSLDGFFKNDQNLEIIEFFNVFPKNNSNLESLNEFCAYCHNLRQVKGINSICFSNVRTMNEVFNDCASLEYVDLTNINAENVIEMKGLLKDCRKIEVLDFKNYKTKNLEYLNEFCSGNTNLKEIKNMDFDTSNVKSYYKMFYNNSSLYKININENHEIAQDNFNHHPSEIRNEQNFEENINDEVTNQTVQNADDIIDDNLFMYVPDNVETINNQHHQNSYLNTNTHYQNLTSNFERGYSQRIKENVLSFDFSNAINLQNMFRGCSNLRTIFLPNANKDIDPIAEKMILKDDQIQIKFDLSPPFEGTLYDTISIPSDEDIKNRLEVSQNNDNPTDDLYHFNSQSNENYYIFEMAQTSCFSNQDSGLNYP